MTALPAVPDSSPAVRLAEVVADLLASPRRPPATELPTPAAEVPPAAGPSRDPGSPPALGAAGVRGTSAARVAPPAPRPAGPEPGAVPPASRLLPPSGLGMSAWRIGAPFAAPAADAAAGTDRSGAGADDDADGALPELFCPGALRDDRALGEEVNERLVAWAEEVGVYPGKLDRLRACNFGRLIMLAHPATSDPDRLLAAAKCVVAEWAADDYYVDEVELGADPRVVGSRLALLHAVIDPAQLPAQYAPALEDYRREEPIATAFRSAMEDLARYTSVTQMGRFQHQMSILFVAWNQEADWHRNSRTPPVWEYLVQRHLNSYLPPMILIDVLAAYELPPHEFYDPRVRRAFTLAGDANVLLNDLHSAGFESDTDYNLPRVIAVEEGCSQRQAIRRTVEIHNELMHMFVAEAAALSLVGSPMLTRFFLDTWAWLGGSREWHATTGRYRNGDGP